ncbi:MAG TPA: D-lyxose/D-mannose family sugar isomerase [Candidatus Didemnitutus sp.]|nr:D-lyxose/D-mannose family sugar isomerase [Candidatus Didemnitutus sp.]
MKRSTINAAYREALEVFTAGGWSLPPRPRWDISDFGSGEFDRCGIAVVNLAEEAEYSEKLIYLRPGQSLPVHTHRKKKEDIICRTGELAMELWGGVPSSERLGSPLRVKRSGDWVVVASGEPFALAAGERVTLVPGVYHRFWPTRPGTIIGEVATANDDRNDNVFVDLGMARFSAIEEDEPRLVRLINES